MSKFGEIINSELPVLIYFYNFINEKNELDTVEFLKRIASRLREKARVVKIEMNKNVELVKALNIKEDPTFILYGNSEMKWRQGGEQDAEKIIKSIIAYL